MSFVSVATATTTATTDKTSAKQLQPCKKCLLPLSQSLDCNVLSSAINFGQVWYHPACLSCTICQAFINCEDNVVIFDGTDSPICSACSMKCEACNGNILEEAVSTGEHTYHPACFKCHTCHGLIENLLFAIVDHDILCVPCHKASSVAKSSSTAITAAAYIRKLESQVTELHEKLAEVKLSREQIRTTADSVSEALVALQEEHDREIGKHVELERRFRLESQARLREGEHVRGLYGSIESLKIDLSKLEQKKNTITQSLEDVKDTSGSRAKLAEREMDQIRSNFQAEIQSLSTERLMLREEVTRLVEKKITLLRELDQQRDQPSRNPLFASGATNASEKRGKLIILTPSPSKAGGAAEYSDPPPLSPSGTNDKKGNSSFFYGNLKSIKTKKEKKSMDELAPTSTISSLDKFRKSEGSETSKSVLGSMTMEKKHSFIMHAYVRKIKCDVCLEKLWGAEQRCEECGYHAHAKCISAITTSACGGESSAHNVVLPELPVFGSVLSKVLEMEHSDIPNIVVKCIVEVENRGMDFEGIYRKSGPLTQIVKIISLVNRGDDLDFSQDESDWDIMAVTSVLKQYFRDLPNPLLTFELYQDFMMASRKLDIKTNVVSGSQKETEKNGMFSQVLGKLPKCNFDTLKFLLKHLDKITQSSTANLMGCGNLGVVFGPTLMRPAVVVPAQDIAESGTKSHCIEYLIRNFKVLFEESEEDGRTVMVAGTAASGEDNIEMIRQ